MDQIDGVQKVKVVVLGVGAVGKSSLTWRYNTNEFLEEYDPTIQDTFRKNIALDGKPAFLEILDTAGQDDYIVMQDVWINGGDGFLLVFALNDENSFQELEKINDRIQCIKGKNTSIIVVGTKADLERHVSLDDAQNFANKIGAQYLEASSKTGQNCNLVFETLVRKIRQQEQPKSQKQNQKKREKKQGFFDKLCTLI